MPYRHDSLSLSVTGFFFSYWVFYLFMGLFHQILLGFHHGRESFDEDLQSVPSRGSIEFFYRV